VAVAYASLNGPAGWVSVFLEDGAVVALDWGRTERTVPGEGLDAAVAELERYFDGASTNFSVPLRPAGGPFRRRVWERLAAIPWGATASYGALAVELGTGPRAVARACAANPIPIIIPCHRVVAASGGLGGYSGGEGIVTKRALLALEGVAVPPASRPPSPAERPHADVRGG
jgi:methylated-DNA-[protein]-cysteine S-methyltransferase